MRSAGGLPPDSLVEREARHPRRLPPRHRGVPRPGTVRDDAGGGRAVLAVLGQPRADARRRGAGALLRCRPAHPPGRERRGCRLFARDSSACGRAPMPKASAGPARDVWHAHCVCLDHGEIELFARTGTGVAHCPARTCGWRAASRRSGGCSMPASRSASASTARLRTTARTCCPRLVRRCCCSVCSAVAPI